MSTRESLADPLRIDRKDFLRMGGLGVAAVVLGTGVSADPAFAQTRFSSNPFTLGVASGDPLPSGFVIWTRLAPAEGDLPNRPIEVKYRVAKDEAMKNVVKKGQVMARPEFGHSVHVDVRGLNPDREYFYRFRVGDYTSPDGRARTVPALGASPAALAFAFVSCQDYQNGFYAAYGALAQQEQDLDFVVHLGDYIYEYGPDPQAVPTREHDAPEIITLADYRRRHALYRRDEDLQEAHRLFPWIVTWDDHETENNYADEIPEEGSETPGRREFLRRRAAAYQAYYEHMPLRRSSLPQGPDMRLYRRFAYGDLAEFSILDTRQYRTDQPCGDGLKDRCAEALSESQTMTGPEQERWLKDGLGNSRALWNVIGQQTMLAEYDFNASPTTELFNMDQWDGYQDERKTITEAFKDVENFVVITGDLHTFIAGYARENYDALYVPDESAPKSASEPPPRDRVGVCFMGGSVTSSNLIEIATLGRGSVDAPAVPGPGAEGGDVFTAQTQSANPHISYLDSTKHGYNLIEVTPEELTCTMKVVDSIRTPQSPSSTLKVFRVPVGTSTITEDVTPGLGVTP